MKCKTCGREIPAENINIQLAIAKCSACSSVFSFYEDIAPGRLREARFENIGLPKGLSLDDTGDELRITRRWFSPLIVFLTVFAAFWDGFLIIWFAIAFSEGQYIMAFTGSIHLLVGICLSYTVLAGYLNSTLIAVNGENLIIYHHPLPWPGTKTLSSPDIAQIYCKVSRRSSQRRGEGAGFEVHALLQDERDVKLIGNLAEDQQALYIEQEIEKKLHIKNRPVRGEILK